MKYAGITVSIKYLEKTPRENLNYSPKGIPYATKKIQLELAYLL